MTPKQIADQIEELIVAASDVFANKVYLVEKRLYNDFLNQLKNLELDSSGYIKQNSANRAILNRAESLFNESINQSGYQNSINKALESIPRIDALNTDYFSSMESSFQVNKRFMASLQRSTITTLENSLLNEGLQAQIRQPLIQILNQNINTGGSFNGMLKQVQEFILGNEDREGKLLRYSKQILKDALFQYSRAYQESVTNDLGLDWYMYEGGIMDKSRPFCIARHGKFFHRKTIESWTSLEWKGKAEGTTESSIFIFVGGYNCNHSLIPVHVSIVPKEDRATMDEE